MMLTNEEKTKLENEIKQLEQITREKDGGDKFADTQVRLGSIYYKLGEKEKAIDVWQQIQCEDNLDFYANAQFNIGVVYNKLGYKEKAIEIWKNIQREDNLEAYSKAQLNLGVAYHELGQKEKAIDIWQQVKQKDNLEAYANAQFYIGIVYNQLGQKEKAINIWQQIKHEDNLEVYTNAQFSLGVVYNDLGQKEKAIDIWQQIKQEDNLETYANAQVSLGVVYHELGQKEKAIDIWQQVKQKDNLEAYANAQMNIGIVYNQLGQKEKAIETWQNIKREDDLAAYVEAQLYIYLTPCELKQEDELTNNLANLLKDFKELFQEKKRFYIQLYINILEFCKNSEYKQLSSYIKLLEYVKVIRSILQVDLQKKLHENKLAHYTDVNVVNKLLNGESRLRLNKIYGMNDPTEGDILFKYLHDELNQNDEYSNIAYTPFITCFTMNHDKLNQFRLYGKSDGKEATGISLVVNQNFFSALPDEEFSFIQINNNIKNELSQSGEDTKSLKAQPIYHCIYIDPESGYIKLAQRDKITFYREYSKDGKKNKVIDRIWKKYQKHIHDKETEIKVQLKNLRTEIEHILEHDEQNKQE